jgi:hypothetical protein
LTGKLLAFARRVDVSAADGESMISIYSMSRSLLRLVEFKPTNVFGHVDVKNLLLLFRLPFTPSQPLL